MMSRDTGPHSSDDVTRPCIHFDGPPRDHPDHQQLKSQPGPCPGCWPHCHIILGLSTGDHTDNLWLVSSHCRCLLAYSLRPSCSCLSTALRHKDITFHCVTASSLMKSSVRNKRVFLTQLSISVVLIVELMFRVGHFCHMSLLSRHQCEELFDCCSCSVH